MLKVLYQTVGDRRNPDEVKLKGPFQCYKSPWLTSGYYFWDTFIDLAHWWGEKGYNGSYIISQYSFEYNSDEIFDLLDPTYLSEFKQCAEIIKNDIASCNITVSQVLEHMRRHTSFPYKGIRAEGRFSISYSNFPNLKNLMPFVKPKYKSTKARLDLQPPVQICLFSKESIKKGSGTIVFPEQYMNIEAI